MADFKVTGPGSGITGPSRTVNKGKPGQSGAFARELGESSSASFEPDTSIVESPVVSSVQALLMAQSVDQTEEREARKRTVRRGEDLLEKLEEIRHGLLLGSIPKQQLMALAQLVRSRREFLSDPRLTALLDEIELRAEVELAKLARRGA